MSLCLSVSFCLSLSVSHERWHWKQSTDYKGGTLDIGVGGGGAGVFAWPFLYFTREMESFIFSPQDKLYISTMPCGQLFIFPANIGLFISP